MGTGEKIDANPVQVIQIFEDIEILQPVSTAGILLVQSEGTLYSIPETVIGLLGSSPTQVSISHIPGLVILVSELEPSDFWMINQRSCLLILNRGGLLDRVSVPSGKRRDRLEIPGMPTAVYAASLDPHDAWLLAETTAPAKKRPEELFALFSVGLPEGRVQSVPRLSSIDMMDMTWSDGLGAFVICDSSSGRLWSWVPPHEEHALLFEPAEEAPVPSVFDLDPGGRWVTTSYQHEETESTQIMRGILTEGSVRWTAPVILPEGDFEDFCWHPSREIFACVRTFQDRALLCVCDAGGAILAETPASEASLGAGLEWSCDGNSVYSLGLQSIGIWQVF